MAWLAAPDADRPADFTADPPDVVEAGRPTAQARAEVEFALQPS
jgi:hypothetical protein